MVNEILQLALSALATFVSGLLLFAVKSKAATAQAQTDAIHERLGTMERKGEELGRDIQITRGALDWVCGTLGKERPNYGPFR